MAVRISQEIRGIFFGGRDLLGISMGFMMDPPFVENYHIQAHCSPDDLKLSGSKLSGRLATSISSPGTTMTDSYMDSI